MPLIEVKMDNEKVNRGKYFLIKNNTKQGYLKAYEGDGVYLVPGTKRGMVQEGMVQA